MNSSRISCHESEYDDELVIQLAQLASASRGMKHSHQLLVTLAALTIGLAAAAETSAITDPASAISAAKRYTKASCNAATPCTYKAQREGKQWRVVVKLTKRNSPRGAARSYAGGEMFLYFDPQGHLIRRLGGE
jgi:hypothetical protein